VVQEEEEEQQDQEEVPWSSPGRWLGLGREMEIEKPLSIVFVCELNPRTRGSSGAQRNQPIQPNYYLL
jgi:hypothetical protein